MAVAGSVRSIIVPKSSAQAAEEVLIIANKLYVGNLAFDTSQADLEELFSPLGEIREIFLPTDRNTGQPRGFAFVEFTDEAAAAKAIEAFHGHELKGRALRVNEAEARAETPRFRTNDRPGRGGGFDSRKRSKPKGSRKNARARKRSL